MRLFQKTLFLCCTDWLAVTVGNTSCIERVDLFDLRFLLQGLNHELSQFQEKFWHSIGSRITGITDHENDAGHVEDDGVGKSWENIRIARIFHMPHVETRHFFSNGQLWKFEWHAEVFRPKCKLIGSDVYCNVATSLCLWDITPYE